MGGVAVELRLMCGPARKRAVNRWAWAEMGSLAAGAGLLYGRWTGVWTQVAVVPEAHSGTVGDPGWICC